MVRQWSLPNYFASKTQKKVQALFFFLAASNKKFQRANAQPTHMLQMQMQIRRDKHVIHNWHSQAFTQLLDSLFCITCFLENNAFSVLNCLTLVYVTSIQDVFCPWNNRSLLYYGAARLLIGNNNNNNNNNNKCPYVFISKILYPLILVNRFIAKEKGSDTSTA